MDVYCKERVCNVEWSVFCVEIEDVLIFCYCGVMLDVCCYFVFIDYIKKFIDVLVVYKMNIFYWYFIDD